jgi:hypothetical protein
MANITKKTSKDIKYLGRDFDSLKSGLVEFTKVYYPDTYNDFNEASPGMMFVELAAYVGDVLNYYVDSQFKETLLLHATERRNILSIASAMGYKPKISVPSQVDLDVYQLFPASGSTANVVHDLRYALKIPAGLRGRSTAGSVEFLVQEDIDFSVDNIYSPTDISVYTVDNNNQPNYYLAKKTVKAISAQPETTNVEVSGTQKFFKFQIEGANLIGIDSIIDADGNTWYEVPYLAQDTIFEKVTNTSYNDPDAAVYSEESPYLLKLKRVPRRFVSRVTETGLEVQFGSGVSSSPDEELLATPENIGLTLPTGKDDIDSSIDPQAPVFTGAYGIAPSNTTLTVTYLVGGGITANVPSNTITEVVAINANTNNFPATTGVLNSNILNSVAINNPTAAVGGRSQETLDEIRQNTLAQFTSQNRAVTREDYIVRAYAMPNVYGSVAKVFITPDEQANIGTSEFNDTVANPLAMNMYVLGYTNQKQCTIANRAIKENLKTYLSQYRMLTDSINIRDAYIINIGVDFDVIALPSFNANEVILNCITLLKDFFDIDKWQIGQPIIYGDIYNLLLQATGVQTVTAVRIKNINDELLDYSNVIYDISEATRNGIIYPSLDPAIFEVKFPDNDIKGRIATF